MEKTGQLEDQEPLKNIDDMNINGLLCDKGRGDHPRSDEESEYFSMDPNSDGELDTGIQETPFSASSKSQSSSNLSEFTPTDGLISSESVNSTHLKSLQVSLKADDNTSESPEHSRRSSSEILSNERITSSESFLRLSASEFFFELTPNACSYPKESRLSSSLETFHSENLNVLEICNPLTPSLLETSTCSTSQAGSAIIDSITTLDIHSNSNLDFFSCHTSLSATTSLLLADSSTHFKNSESEISNRDDLSLNANQNGSDTDAVDVTDTSNAVTCKADLKEESGFDGVTIAINVSEETPSIQEQTDVELEKFEIETHDEEEKIKPKKMIPVSSRRQVTEETKNEWVDVIKKADEVKKWNETLFKNNNNLTLELKSKSEELEAMMKKSVELDKQTSMFQSDEQEENTVELEVLKTNRKKIEDIENKESTKVIYQNEQGAEVNDMTSFRDQINPQEADQNEFQDDMTKKWVCFLENVNDFKKWNDKLLKEKNLTALQLQEKSKELKITRDRKSSQAKKLVDILHSSKDQMEEIISQLEKENNGSFSKEKSHYESTENEIEIEEEVKQISKTHVVKQDLNETAAMIRQGAFKFQPKIEIDEDKDEETYLKKNISDLLYDLGEFQDKIVEKLFGFVDYANEVQKCNEELLKERENLNFELKHKCKELEVIQEGKCRQAKEVVEILQGSKSKLEEVILDLQEEEFHSDVVIENEVTLNKNSPLKTEKLQTKDFEEVKTSHVPKIDDGDSQKQEDSMGEGLRNQLVKQAEEVKYLQEQNRCLMEYLAEFKDEMRKRWDGLMEETDAMKNRNESVYKEMNIKIEMAEKQRNRGWSKNSTFTINLLQKQNIQIKRIIRCLRSKKTELEENIQVIQEQETQSKETMKILQTSKYQLQKTIMQMQEENFQSEKIIENLRASVSKTEETKVLLQKENSQLRENMRHLKEDTKQMASRIQIFLQ